LLIFVPILSAVKTDSFCDLLQNFAANFPASAGGDFKSAVPAQMNFRTVSAMSFAPSTIASTAPGRPFVAFQIVCLL
jgi:hypothetical protein